MVEGVFVVHLRQLVAVVENSDQARRKVIVRR